MLARVRPALLSLHASTFIWFALYTGYHCNFAVVPTVKNVRLQGKKRSTFTQPFAHRNEGFVLA